MLIFLEIVFAVLVFVFLLMSAFSYEHFELYFILMGVFFILAIGLGIFGYFHGFINYPKTEGTHQGIITAVDLEGVYFRRYEIYLKSSGYTNQSDETKYLIYDYEKELADELKNAIGKTVQLKYGHDGGYIGWKSCGTYHIKSFEIIEQN